jgi:hypothetical protein
MRSSQSVKPCCRDVFMAADYTNREAGVPDLADDRRHVSDERLPSRGAYVNRAHWRGRPSPSLLSTRGRPV